MRLFKGALDKMLGMETLAGKPPLHVDEAGQNRIDLASRCCGFQFVERQLSTHDRHPCFKK